MRERLKENVRDEPLRKRTPAKEEQALPLRFGHRDLSYRDPRGTEGPEFCGLVCVHVRVLANE